MQSLTLLAVFGVPSEMLVVLGALSIALVLGAAQMARTRGVYIAGPALVLKQFAVTNAPADGIYVTISGRPQGVAAWVLSITGLGADTTFQVSARSITLASASLGGMRSVIENVAVDFAKVSQLIVVVNYLIAADRNGDMAQRLAPNERRAPVDYLSATVDDPIAATPLPVGSFSAVATGRSSPPPLPSTAPTVSVTCSGCGTGYRVPAQPTAARVRCKHCQGVVEIPAGASPS
jgi:hypothetical protein